MRKLTLLTSVLLASSFQTVNVSAQCMNTINCQALGYTKTSCTKGGVKCPTGNYWYCPESQCDSSYQYTCTGYMQSPSGTACNGKYQKCNCSNNYVWNSTQGLCLACTSLCMGYTLTYEQAVSQCGSSNAFACLDNCTGNRMYKCGTNTGSGSDSGSDSGSGSGSGYTCQNVVEHKANYTTSCSCNSIGGQYRLTQTKHYVCEQGISLSTPDWHITTSLGRYARESECQNALNENSSECTGSGSVYPSTFGQYRCHTKCLD